MTAVARHATAIIAPSVAAGYDLWATSYDHEPNVLIALDSAEPVQAKRLGAIRLSQGGAALDIGCGTGRHLPLLDANFTEVTGVDLSLEMLKQARTQINPAKTRLVNADVLGTDESERFDFIHASLSLMHIADVFAFFQKVRTLLAPGGVFFCIDADDTRLRLGMAPSFWRDGAEIHVPFGVHGFDEIVTAAHRSGLVINESGRIPAPDEVIAQHPKFERYRGKPCLYYLTAMKEASA